MNINGEAIIINSGLKGDGLRKGDKLLIVRREHNNWSIHGTSQVVRAYDTDAECENVLNVGIRPEDEVYVLNRRSSPHEISHLGF